MKPMWILNLPKPFSCRALAPAVTRYVEAAHTLSPAEQTGVAAHLSACASCRAEAETVRAVGQLIRQRGHAALPAHVPAADLWDRIEARIIAQESVASQTRRRSSALRPVLLFAPALAAVVVAAVLVPRLATAPSPSSNKEVATVAAEIAPATSAKQEIVPAAAPVANVDSRLRYKAVAGAAVPRPVAPKQVASTPRRAPVQYVLTTVAAPQPVVARAKRATRRTPAQVALQLAVKPRLAPQTVPTPAPITIVMMEPTVASAVVAAAVAVEPKATTPSLAGNPRPANTFAGNTFPGNTIRVVQSDTGNGVPDSAANYSPSPVSDTLIRQRQKRGLFGGYGAATLATGNTGAGSGTASPW